MIVFMVEKDYQSYEYKFNRMKVMVQEAIALFVLPKNMYDIFRKVKKQIATSTLLLTYYLYEQLSTLYTVVARR